jgi:hypothetical protein
VKLLVLLTSAAAIVGFAGEELQAKWPPELVADAARRGCTPVSDATDSSDTNVGFFRAGVLEDTAGSPALPITAYWCREGNEPFRYALVLYRANRALAVPGGCADIIRPWRRPGSLSFEPRTRVSIELFTRVSDRTSAQRSEVTSGTALFSAAGGQEHRFICHRGEWFVEVRH